MPIAGVEYTLPKLRAHYTLPIGRMHFTLPTEGDSMRSTAREIREITTDEVRVVSVSFLGKLDTGELLTGTPTVTAEAGAGLTLSNKTVNSEAVTINSVSHAIGQAVQFKVDATAATDGEWTIDITCATDNGQTVFGRVTVDVESS